MFMDAVNEQLKELEKQLSVVEIESKRIKSLIKLLSKTQKDFKKLNEGGTIDENEDQREDI